MIRLSIEVTSVSIIIYADDMVRYRLETLLNTSLRLAYNVRIQRMFQGMNYTVLLKSYH